MYRKGAKTVPWGAPVLFVDGRRPDALETDILTYVN